MTRPRVVSIALLLALAGVAPASPAAQPPATSGPAPTTTGPAPADGQTSGPASPATAPTDGIDEAALAKASAESDELVIRFLEARIRRDPDDVMALNRLGGLYLRQAHQTGSIDYLLLAQREARLSLSAEPGQENLGGLLLRGRVEFASHEFVRARDTGADLARWAPDKGSSFALLGDALLELGDYESADAAYQRMARLDPAGPGSLTRLGRLEMLRGHVDAARARFTAAMNAAAGQSTESPDLLAWCRWQLGDLAFKAGDYPAAERWQRLALRGAPGYYRALGSLGQALAAEGDRRGAIAAYEHAVAVIPQPIFLAALGDLFALDNDAKRARQQYVIVEQIDRLSTFHGVLYNRQMALFWADHDQKPDLAYTSAVREYADRKDVYGADALAWCALKAGKLPEANAAARAALRLGTSDAKIFYHAGMVASTTGDSARAVELLGKALALSPHFDPLQAPRCRAALEQARSRAKE